MIEKQIDEDLKIRIKSYKVGDVVYLLDTASMKGQSKKLSPLWKGPMVIVEKYTPYVYKMKFRNTFIVGNHDCMKLCTETQSRLPKWIVEFQKNLKKYIPKPLPQDNKVYYHCQGPDVSRLMIQCEYCMEWYHGSCIKVTEAESKKIDKYKCMDCINRQIR